MCAPPEDLVVRPSIYPVNVAIECEITSPSSVGDELNVDLCICHCERKVMMSGFFPSIYTILHLVFIYLQLGRVWLNIIYLQLG